MSNEDEAEFLNSITNEKLEGEVEDRIIGLDNDNVPDRSDMQAEVKAEVPKFTPKVPKKSTESVVTSEDIHAEELRLLKQQVTDATNAIKLLVAGRDNVKLVKTPVVIDWTKMSEKDVFDMSVPIELVDHSMPDYMKVELKDSNFVPRWVHKMDRRLGPMKSKGFLFVTADEIQGELNIAISPNADGIFQHDDVFLMKIEKRKYFGMLRANHERALKMIDPRAAHKVAQDRVISDLSSAPNDGKQPNGRMDKTAPGDFGKYSGANKLEVYI